MSPANDIHSNRWRALISRHLLDELSEDEFAELEVALRDHREARDMYRFACHMDARLRSLAEEIPPPRYSIAKWVPRIALAAAAVLVFGLSIWWFSPNTINPPAIAAHLGKSSAQWLTSQFELDQPLLVGQRLELSSGSAQINFVNGAITRLQGPAIFEIENLNGGFLIAGRAYARADTPESHGFFIRTRTAKIIDKGTEFLTNAGLDGHSQIEVTSGEVDVEIPGYSLQRILSGNALGVEPGAVTILAKIERGDETPAFRFATIEPPSDEDFADGSRGNARISLMDKRGASSDFKIHDLSGPVSVLLDGKGQSGQDVPEDSVFFPEWSEGMILLDLGEAVWVSKVNTYSWHQPEKNLANRVRAVQKFTLWGFNGNVLPYGEGSLEEDDWVRIARVNSDAFFNVSDPADRPAQQACSIFSEEEALGQFRFLLFDVQPTNIQPRSDLEPIPNHTFYGEIDVFASP